MNIHEDKIRRRIRFEPGDALRNAVEHIDDLHLGRDLLQQRLQIANGGLFVLND